MSVHVGIDVHRKRSQVAVLEADGQQRFNRNVINGSVELAELLGGLPAGTPVAFEACGVQILGQAGELGFLGSLACERPPKLNGFNFDRRRLKRSSVQLESIKLRDGVPGHGLGRVFAPHR